MTADGAFARRQDLAIRAMTPEDLPMLTRWRNEPHVLRWWQLDDDPLPWTLEDVRREYEPSLSGADPMRLGIIEVGERPVGFLQWFRWADEAEAAAEMGVPHGSGAFGVDIFIGEADAVGKGVGSGAIDLLCTTLFERYGATSVSLLTAVGNQVAQRAYEKAGLTKVRRALDTDVKDGARVESWLMVREVRPPAGPVAG